MLESSYQAQLIAKLEDRFFCLVLKNDEQFRQGIVDLTILFDGGRWAALEVKISEKAPYRPNQPYYLKLMGLMSWSATIYPENEEEILRELEQAFPDARCRETRDPKSKQQRLGQLHRREA